MRIGLIGKYIELPDAYLSVVESLKHAGFHHGAKVEIDWIQSENVEGLLAAGQLDDLDGIVIPGGFGYRGFEGKIAAARYAREEGVPCLGLCLGLQAMASSSPATCVGLVGANSTEFDPTTQHPVIDLMLDQRDIEDKGGTMRLGAYYAVLEPGQQGGRRLRRAGRERTPPSPLRVQPKFRARLEEAGLVVQRHVARQPARRVHRAARPPVLGGHPGAPGVQEPARPCRIRCSAS